VNVFQKKALRSVLKAKPYLKELAKRLLSLGGDCPQLWFDTPVKGYALDLMYLGRPSNGRGARLKKMADNECHINSEELAARYAHVFHETGFALSPDGVWRPHSWAWDSRKNQIIETTVLREKYYGVTLPWRGKKTA
jgi:hypothetical protein